MEKHKAVTLPNPRSHHGRKGVGRGIYGLSEGCQMSRIVGAPHRAK